MHHFAKIYARHTPSPTAAQPSRSNPQPRRVRIERGILAGLTGKVVSTVDPNRWLIETDQRGLLVRVSPTLLVPVGHDSRP